MVKASAIQMVSSNILQQNLQLAEQLVIEACTQGAKLVLLPENFALVSNTEEAKLAIKEVYATGEIQAFLSSLANKHNIYLIGGTIPIVVENSNKVRAACLVYGPDGEILSRYDKIHLFDVSVNQQVYIESNAVEPGMEIEVFTTPFARIGLSVCYDLRFPEMYREMTRRGVDIIVVPAAFTAVTGKAHWEVLLRARAIENLCYVLAANQGGLHQSGRETYGHSMIVSPWGEKIAECEQGNAIVTATLDFNKQQEIRKKFPALTHCRIR